jgi:hypothetical protein
MFVPVDIKLGSKLGTVLGSTFGTTLGIRPETGLDEELVIELCII